MVNDTRPTVTTVLTVSMIIPKGVHIGTSELVFRASNSNVFSVTMVIILGSTVLAFFLNVSEFLLVYHTSGITLSIAGIVKVCKHFNTTV